MANPLISVIIPTYNHAEYIRDAIDSALAQTYRNIEIVVVDDGSIDGTGDILRQYDSQISYVFQNNAGVAAARNNGIRRARGNLLAFLDSDDIWLPEKLELQVRALGKSKAIGLVSCGSYTIDASGKMVAGPRIRRNYSSRKAFLRELILHNVIGGGSFPLVRKECFDRLGPFCEDLLGVEDRDMWIRIAKHYDIRFIEKPLVKYRLHRANIHRNTARIKSDSEKLVKRNVEKWRFFLRRKAFSHVYLDAAHEYLGTFDRPKALVNVIEAIMSYPLRVHDKDDKYQVLCKCLFPPGMLRFLRDCVLRGDHDVDKGEPI